METAEKPVRAITAPRTAALAFEAAAPAFDERFGSWASVAAQRRSVREVLLQAFAGWPHF